MKFTDLQMLRQTLILDKQDLERFLADPITNAQSVATVRRVIAEKEVKIAMLEGGDNRSL